jgi:ADP-ribose pyrophosphatase
MIKQRRLLHQGRVFKLFSDDVVLPNGTATCIDVIRHPGAAAIVAWTTTDHIVLIKQYRYSLDAEIWEIPAGTLDAMETPLACAQRELGEETGFQAAQWEVLGSMTPVPGYSDEQLHLYLARDLTPVPRALDADEIVNVSEIPFEQALEMVDQGLIQDAKTIAALFKTLRWRQVQLGRS